MRTMVFVSGYVYCMQIFFNFLTFKPNDLCSTDLNDYKQSKAYSYFQCGWLGPISYHPIMLSSLYCLLKADCRPSGGINDLQKKKCTIWKVIWFNVLVRHGLGHD